MWPPFTPQHTPPLLLPPQARAHLRRLLQLQRVRQGVWAAWGLLDQARHSVGQAPSASLQPTAPRVAVERTSLWLPLPRRCTVTTLPAAALVRLSHRLRQALLPLPQPRSATVHSRLLLSPPPLPAAGERRRCRLAVIRWARRGLNQMARLLRSCLSQGHLRWAGGPGQAAQPAYSRCLSRRWQELPFLGQREAGGAALRLALGMEHRGRLARSVLSQPLVHRAAAVAWGPGRQSQRCLEQALLPEQLAARFPRPPLQPLQWQRRQAMGISTAGASPGLAWASAAVWLQLSVAAAELGLQAHRYPLAAVQTRSTTWRLQRCWVLCPSLGATTSYSSLAPALLET